MKRFHLAMKFARLPSPGCRFMKGDQEYIAMRERAMILQGKTAVISGAAGPRGIGLATAKLFAQHGARVAILDIDGEGAAKAAASLGKEHLGLACDVTDLASCQKAIAATIE